MMKKGLLIIVSGFSGAGKGSIIKELIKKHKSYALSISATTRAPRHGEKDGREYFFVSRDEFEAMIEAGELIEYANYVGNYYGTPKKYVVDRLSKGDDVILEIEIQGAAKVREKFPEAVFIFVAPPDVAVLKSRLIARGTEDNLQIEKRLERASQECDSIKMYDYILINDVLDEAVELCHSIVKTEHCKIEHCADYIADIQKDLIANHGCKIRSL